jgi:methylphosphotriester-DNA--protein-cysteine methyltransferase
LPRSPGERARVLDIVLAGWAADADCPAPVDAFWRALTSSAGRASVTSIAGQIGLSPRHLGQLVRAELGLTPKTAARVLRFAEAQGGRPGDLQGDPGHRLRQPDLHGR